MKGALARNEPLFWKVNHVKKRKENGRGGRGEKRKRAHCVLHLLRACQKLGDAGLAWKYILSNLVVQLTVCPDSGGC